jgi:hypothetical protein
MSNGSVSKKAVWAGHVIGVLPVLLLVFSAVMKFVKPAGFDDGMQHLGWSAGKMNGLGIVEIAICVLYLIPQTAVLGAILITAYMGGAIATHLRVDDPYFIQIGVGILVWLGLYLRDPRIRSLIPIRS